MTKAAIILLGCALWLGLPLEAAAGTPGVLFAWAGAITPNRATINARLDGDSTQVRVRVSRNMDFSDARVSEFQNANLVLNNRVVSFLMPGLEASQSYHYAVEVEGVLDLAQRGRFTTPTDSVLSFSFAFASCAKTGSSRMVFDTIRALDPLFFFHLGDLHYQNIGVNDPELFRAAYDSVLESPAQSELYRSVPIAYMWDDHDYGPDNSDSTAPGRESSRLTYQEYVPHYPLVYGQGDVPITQAFSVGRVLFLVPDLRSERDPHTMPDTPAKSMFGAAQKAWFKQELLEANGVYPVIVWINTMPWIGSGGGDGWYSYSVERAEIADFIALNGIEGVVMLSGDAHMLAIDDGTNSDYSATGNAAIPVFHGAALDRPASVKGGPYSHGAFGGGGQFGLMTVQDDGLNPICIEWSGRDETNLELVGYQFCQPVAPPLDTDQDGLDDLDDCSFADADLWAPPVNVSGVLLQKNESGDAELAWDDQAPDTGPATRYDIVTGSVDALVQNAGFDSAACLAPGVENASHVDSSAGPSPGQPRYYLVRARNDCGSVGYGHVDAVDPRFALDGNTPCAFP